jgi:autotransporter-associated beta strand protein
MKPSFPRNSTALPLAFTLVLALSGAAHAATIYWDNSGGTANSWADVANWSTVLAGGTNPSAIPGSADVATFSATPIQGTVQTVNLNADQSVLGLDILSGVTANTTLASGGTARTLTIGASGIINAGSGVVTIGNAAGGGASVNVVFAGSQSIANNGSGNIFLHNNITGTGSPTITNNGTGTGQVLIFGSDLINNTVSGFVQDSATSTLRLRNIGANTFSGGVVIRKGTLNFGNSANNLGTGTVTLGNGSGGSDAATLDVADNSNQSFANAIALASFTTGTLTFRLSEDSTSGSHSKTFTGGITGSNSLTIQNNGGTGAAADTLTFTTGAINNAGTLTHIGTGAGLTTISSVIGTNVTGLTQNSSTSTLVLGGTNTFSGATTVSSGALRLSNQNALQNSTVTMGGGSGAALTFASSVGGRAFTLGGLAASASGAGYNISLLNNAGTPLSIALTVGGNNASTTYAGVLSGTGGSLIKTGTGTLSLTGTNTYTGATSVNDGTLIVDGSISTSTTTTVSSGATLGGSGTVGALTINSGGFVTPGNSPGILTVGNYSQAGQYTAEIAGTTAGTGHDQIDVAGTVNLTGGTLVTMFSGSYTPGNIVFILRNDGTDAITGTFAGLAQGATAASYGSMDWQISYTANTLTNLFTGGNDIALMAIPEPSQITVAGIGLAMLLGRRSRSRQNHNNA